MHCELITGQLNNATLHEPHTYNDRQEGLWIQKYFSKTYLDGLF